MEIVDLRTEALNQRLEAVGQEDNYPLTTLQLAVVLGKHEMVKDLLKNATYNAQEDVNGVTPLHMAVHSGHMDVIKILLNDSRIEVDKKDDMGKTAIELAEEQEEHHKKLEKDRPRVTRDHGRLAKKYKYIQCMIKKDFTTTYDAGSTPLHLASACGYVNGVELHLGDSSIDVHKTNDAGKTALALAIEEKEYHDGRARDHYGAWREYQSEREKEKLDEREELKIQFTTIKEILASRARTKP